MNIDDNLELPFLADRNYLHGTTLFDALLAYVPDGAGVGFKIPSLIETNRVRVTTKQRADQTPCAILNITGAEEDEGGEIFVFPLMPSEKPLRQSRDEAGLIDICRFEDKGISFLGEPPLSFISMSVFMNKALIRKHAGQNPSLMFVRAEFERVPDSFRELGLTIDHIAGNGISLSSVIVNGMSVGKLYFFQSGA